MTCATSLTEEFNQYVNELRSFESRIVGISKTRPDPAFTVSLIEINQTLDTLNHFNVQTESSHAIHYMAERATSLIDRLRQQCDYVTNN